MSRPKPEEIARDYCSSPAIISSLTKEIREYGQHKWKQAVAERDDQLAERFPASCAFIKRLNPEKPDFKP